MSTAVCSSRRVKRETASQNPPPVVGLLAYASILNKGVANGSGSVTLTWWPPDFLADGVTPISSNPITSYTIYYSTADGTGTGGTPVTVASPAAVSHTFTCGAAAVVYFVLVTNNATGASAPSAQMSFAVS